MKTFSIALGKILLIFLATMVVGGMAAYIVKSLLELVGI